MDVKVHWHHAEHHCRGIAFSACVSNADLTDIPLQLAHAMGLLESL